MTGSDRHAEAGDARAVGFLRKCKKERNAVVWHDATKRLGVMKNEAGS